MTAVPAKGTRALYEYGSGREAEIGLYYNDRYMGEAVQASELPQAWAALPGVQRVFFRSPQPIIAYEKTAERHKGGCEP